MIVHQYAENLASNLLYQTCLKQFKSRLPENVEHIVHTSCDLFKYSLRVRSEAFRFKLLSECKEDCMWADADTTISKWPDFSSWDKSKPMISSPDNNFPNADVCISFGHQDWFKIIYEEHEKLSKGETVYQTILNNHQGEFNFVPEGYFNAINLNVTHNKNCVSVGSDNFCVVKDSKGEWEFSFLRDYTIFQM